MEGKTAAQPQKASHAGIIRIGFEGIFSAPPSKRSTPVSIIQLKHLRGGNGKFARSGSEMGVNRSNCGIAAHASAAHCRFIH